jgi:hypothetical protein
VHANAGEARKKARAVEPGSFLNLMINSKHSNGEPFSDLLASSQAFTFLLVSILAFPKCNVSLCAIAVAGPNLCGIESHAMTPERAACVSQDCSDSSD